MQSVDKENMNPVNQNENNKDNVADNTTNKATIKTGAKIKPKKKKTDNKKTDDKKLNNKIFTIKRTNYGKAYKRMPESLVNMLKQYGKAKKVGIMMESMRIVCHPYQFPTAAVYECIMDALQQKECYSDAAVLLDAFFHLNQFKYPKYELLQNDKKNDDKSTGPKTVNKTAFISANNNINNNDILYNPCSELNHLNWKLIETTINHLMSADSDEITLGQYMIHHISAMYEHMISAHQYVILDSLFTGVQPHKAIQELGDLEHVLLGKIEDKDTGVDAQEQYTHCWNDVHILLTAFCNRNDNQNGLGAELRKEISSKLGSLYQKSSYGLRTRLLNSIMNLYPVKVRFNVLTTLLRTCADDCLVPDAFQFQNNNAKPSLSNCLYYMFLLPVENCNNDVEDLNNVERGSVRFIVDVENSNAKLGDLKNLMATQQSQIAERIDFLPKYTDTDCEEVIILITNLFSSLLEMEEKGHNNDLAAGPSSTTVSSPPPTEATATTTATTTTTTTTTAATTTTIGNSAKDLYNSTKGFSDFVEYTPDLIKLFVNRLSALSIANNISKKSSVALTLLKNLVSALQ